MEQRNKKGQFIKGIVPWNNNKKGIHLSTKSEWKKGHKTWNKGKIWLAMRGKNHPRPQLGKTTSKKQKEVARQNWLGSKNPRWNNNKPKCIDCGKKIKGYLSKRCRSCWVKYYRGKNTYHWAGGVSGIRRLIRRSYKYRQWRSDVFTRDDFICQLCGKRGNRIEADHYPKMFSEILRENKIKTIEDAFNCEELWNINNGRTLCYGCHHPKNNGI